MDKWTAEDFIKRIELICTITDAQERINLLTNIIALIRSAVRNEICEALLEINKNNATEAIPTSVLLKHITMQITLDDINELSSKTSTSKEH